MIRQTLIFLPVMPVGNGLRAVSANPLPSGEKANALTWSPIGGMNGWCICQSSHRRNSTLPLSNNMAKASQTNMKGIEFGGNQPFCPRCLHRLSPIYAILSAHLFPNPLWSIQQQRKVVQDVSPQDTVFLIGYQETAFKCSSEEM